MRGADGGTTLGPVLDRRLLLGALSASGAMMLPGVADTRPGASSLAALASEKGLMFGMALTRDQVWEAPALAALSLARFVRAHSRFHATVHPPGQHPRRMRRTRELNRHGTVERNAARIRLGGEEAPAAARKVEQGCDL